MIGQADGESDAALIVWAVNHAEQLLDVVELVAGYACCDRDGARTEEIEAALSALAAEEK